MDWIGAKKIVDFCVVRMILATSSVRRTSWTHSLFIDVFSNRIRVDEKRGVESEKVTTKDDDETPQVAEKKPKKKADKK